jgi:hypothetical protein
LRRAVSTARRDTSTAVASAPRNAAVTASRPLPVQTSSTRAPGGSVSRRRASASIHESEIGEKTPGRVTMRTRSGFPRRAPGKR